MSDVPRSHARRAWLSLLLAELLDEARCSEFGEQHLRVLRDSRARVRELFLVPGRNIGAEIFLLCGKDVRLMLFLSNIWGFPGLSELQEDEDGDDSDEALTMMSE